MKEDLLYYYFILFIPIPEEERLNPEASWTDNFHPILNSVQTKDETALRKCNKGNF